mmetsp:Transcript_15415/g.33519  ORF Transcript_15415/g.33519 Transcript_15415/m.33519 type:complete len:112 (-) Transcript_15415:55-390(-)
MSILIEKWLSKDIPINLPRDRQGEFLYDWDSWTTVALNVDNTKRRTLVRSLAQHFESSLAPALQHTDSYEQHYTQFPHVLQTAMERGVQDVARLSERYEAAAAYFSNDDSN